MHHVHISTPALFVLGLFLFGLITVILAAVATIKRDRRAAEVAIERSKQPVSYPQHNAMTRDGSWPQQAYRDGGIVHASPPVYVTPGYTPYYGVDPTLAVVEGMLIGEALSSHHTTVVENNYVDTAPSYDSTPSYDSGISYDSSPSYDSGGIDMSWD